MATLQPEQQQTTEQQAKVTTSDQPQLGGGQTATLGEGQQATPQTQQKAPTSDQKRSGMGQRLSNLRKYVQANVGQQMAQKLGQDIEGRRQKTQEAVAKSKGLAETATQQAQQRLQKGEQLVGEKGLFERGKTTEYTSAPESQTFAEYGQTPQERLAAFQKYKAGEAEKIGIEGEQQLTQDIGELQRRGELAKTEQGRFQLLRDVYKRPDYTRGQQRLDQLLIQSQPEQIKRLMETTKEYQIPKEQLEALRQLTGESTAAIEARAKGLAGTIGEKMYGSPEGPTIDPQTGQIIEAGGAIGEFQQRLEQQTQAARDEAARQYQAIQAKLGFKQDESGTVARDLTADDLTKLGVSAEQAPAFLEAYEKLKPKSIKERLDKGIALSGQDKAAIAQATGIPAESVELSLKGGYGSFEEFMAANPTIQEEWNRRTAPVTALGGDITQADRDLLAKNIENAKQDIKAKYDSAYQQANREAAANKAILDQEIQGGTLGQIITEKAPIDFSQFARGLEPEQITTQRVASAEDYARQAALQSLAERRFGTLAPEQAAMAGTYKDLGVGRIDMSKAMGAARDFLNPPEGAAPIDFQQIPENDPSWTQLAFAAATPGFTDLSQNLTNVLDPGSNMSQRLKGIGGLVTDPIKSSKNSVIDITNKALGGSFWCTRAFNARLITKSELSDLHAFMFRVMFRKAKFFAWYIDNGTNVMNSAIKSGYDWENVAQRIKNTVSYYKQGDLDSAILQYGKLTEELCEFIGFKAPKECYKDSIWVSMTYAPKVFKFYIPKFFNVRIPNVYTRTFTTK